MNERNFNQFPQLVTLEGEDIILVWDESTQSNRKIRVNQITPLVQGSFGGSASPSDTPNITNNIWYFATISGTYTNFGGLVVDVTEGLTILVYDGSVWEKSVVPIDFSFDTFFNNEFLTVVAVINSFYYASGSNNLASTSSTAGIRSTAPINVQLFDVIYLKNFSLNAFNGLSTIGKLVRSDGTFVRNLIFSDLILVDETFTLKIIDSDVNRVVFNILTDQINGNEQFELFPTIKKELLPNPQTGERVISYENLKREISYNQLKVGERLIVHNFKGKTFSTFAETNNSISELVKLHGENYDFFKLNLSNDIIEAFDILSGSIRRINDNWAFIIDGNHKPVNLQSVSSSGNNIVRVNYLKTYTKVVSFLITPDEAYTLNGINVGASVGLSFADISMSQQNLWGEVSGISGTLSIINSGFMDSINSLSFNNSTGEITVNHKTMNLNPIPSIQSKTPCIPSLINYSNTSFSFRCLNFQGNPILDISEISFVFCRHGTRVLRNDEMGVTSSNFWISGLMIKEF